MLKAGYQSFGDILRLSRREKAKADIITKQSPINNLAMIIDKGVGTDLQSRHEAPIKVSIFKISSLSVQSI